MGAKSALNRDEDFSCASPHSSFADGQPKSSAEPVISENLSNQTGANTDSTAFAAAAEHGFKKFVPPVLSDMPPDMPPDMSVSSDMFSHSESKVRDGNLTDTPLSKAKADKKASYLEKIEQAKKAQAESQSRADTAAEQGKTNEKNIPVDAVNIIHLPASDGGGEDFSDTVDYSEDEDRLANARYNEQAFSVMDLFGGQEPDESEKEAVDWHEFLGYCEEHGFPAEYVPLMQSLKVTLTKTHCFIKVSSGPQAGIFSKVKNQLEELLGSYLGRSVTIRSTIVAYELASDAELRERAKNNPQIQMLMNEFNAEIYRCYDIKHDRKN